MKKPCANCPFRKDRPFNLRKSRAKELAAGLMGDADFPCHKTLGHDNNGDTLVTRNSTRCIGAAIFLENVRPGGMLANVHFRFAARFGELTPEELSSEVPVYGSIADFIGGVTQ